MVLYSVIYNLYHVDTAWNYAERFGGYFWTGARYYHNRHYCVSNLQISEKVIIRVSSVFLLEKEVSALRYNRYKVTPHRLDGANGESEEENRLQILRSKRELFLSL